MGLEQKAMRSLVGQFHRPHGAGGRAVGWIMATRGSNRKRNAAAVREGRVDLQLGTAEQLPRFDQPFDKILAVNSLMFWDDPVARLEELRRLLRPGGRLAIAFQPRAPASTDETAAQAGDDIAKQFAAAGFSDVRIETLELRPTNAVCVLGAYVG